VNEVAKLTVKFTLAAPGKIKFDFIFGSVEFPEFTSNFTDAFLVFLDGTAPANQITFDALGDPVLVGASFESELTTADLNTAFASPHGLISNLTTVSADLAAGDHTIHFEVGDVNDDVLDSAVFITNFALCVPSQGQTCQTGTTPNGVAERGSLALLGLALAGLAAVRRRKQVA
jgi:MYXO-CTERM domain-containing protein